jgi:hypothetical protein
MYSPSNYGIKMPGAIDARKVGRSIDGPLGHITPDLTVGYAAFENCGWLAVGPYPEVDAGLPRLVMGSRHLVRKSSTDETGVLAVLIHNLLDRCRDS